MSARVLVDPAALSAARLGVLRGGEQLFAAAHHGPGRCCAVASADIAGSATADALRDLGAAADAALDGAATATRSLADLLGSACRGYVATDSAVAAAAERSR